MMLPWRRLFGFGALQLFGAVSPLLVLPLVVRMIGVEGWVGLSVGYAVGAAAAIAVSLAWTVTGPSRVAAVSPLEAARVFRESVTTRLLMVAPVSILSTTASVLLAPVGHRTLSGAMCLATAASGLASNWYYIGRGQPNGILLYESVPKLGATVLTVAVVAVTHQALYYPGLLLLASVGGAALSAQRILGPFRGQLSMLPGWWRRMRHNAFVAVSAVIGAGYTSLAVPIVRLAGIGLVPVADFAGSLRIRSMAQVAPASSTSALQGWVSESDDRHETGRRMRHALAINGWIGVATAAFIAVVSPFADSVLFGTSVQISPLLAVVTGLACVPYSLSASLSFHVLAPLGATRTVASSRIVATAIGVPALFVLAKESGAVGAASAALLSEVLVVVLQSAAAARAWRRIPAHRSDHEEYPSEDPITLP